MATTAVDRARPTSCHSAKRAHLSVLEGPASIFARIAVEKIFDVIDFAVGPHDKFALVYEVNLHRIAAIIGIPFQRELIAGFQFEALRPRFDRYVDWSVLLVAERMLGLRHAFVLEPFR